MRRGAFSLVESLLVAGVIALLTGVLLPALRSSRQQAQRVVCAAHLRELGHGFHMYATEYVGRAMPLAYTDPAIVGNGPAIYWWGTNDDGGVDHTRGFLWPYLQSDLKKAGLFECPAQPWGTYYPQGAARAVTSTFGYNGYYLCPPHTPGWAFTIGRQPWKNIDAIADPQRLFVFADALIDLGADRPHNNALLDPPWLFDGRRWRPNPCPTTAFRHLGRANATLADGHVAAYRPCGRLASPRFGIGSAGPDNDPHYVPDWRQW